MCITYTIGQSANDWRNEKCYISTKYGNYYHNIFSQPRDDKFARKVIPNKRKYLHITSFFIICASMSVKIVIDFQHNYYRPTP